MGMRSVTGSAVAGRGAQDTRERVSALLDKARVPREPGPAPDPLSAMRDSAVGPRGAARLGAAGAAGGAGALPDPPGGVRVAARRRSWREAAFERLPVWVQLRCGMELRTVAALAGVLVLAAAFAVHHFWIGRPRAVEVPVAVREPATAPVAAGASPGSVVVDVAGKVRRPGVVRLPAGSRVTDALQAAGGALPDTDTSALNLARVLVDGEQVAVGRAPAAAPATGAAAGSGTGPPGTVSLNTATLEQLESLPGVGPVLARHIIEFRDQHGGFTSVGQLRQISGVGERRLKDLQPLVRP
jgi:competence protein ComEA